jgi:hypothetical protein
MSTKFFNFLCMSWFVSVLISVVTDGVGFGTNEMSVINDLRLFTMTNLGMGITVPVWNLNFFQGVYRLLSFDYGFYGAADSGWQMIRWFWVAILSPGAIWGIGSSVASIFAQFVKVF